MSRLFFETKTYHLSIGFTYTVNFWDFFIIELNRRAMTEEKTRDAKPRHVAQ